MDYLKRFGTLRGTSWLRLKHLPELCITRQIITAIKTATRQKHIPLNSYVSLDKPAYDDDTDRTLLDEIHGSLSNPEEIYISQEEYNDIEDKIAKILSDLERKVLMLFWTDVLIRKSRST